MREKVCYCWSLSGVSVQAFLYCTKCMREGVSRRGEGREGREGEGERGGEREKRGEGGRGRQKEGREDKSEISTLHMHNHACMSCTLHIQYVYYINLYTMYINIA